MMKKLFQNKKFKYTFIGIIATIVICLGVTYAYWMLTKEQTNKDVVKSACLKIDFSGKNDITLDEAYPMEEDELEYFLNIQTPYHFTITNKCNNLQNAVINLETLNVSNTLLEDDYIDVLLYEEDYHNNLNSSKKLTGNTINDSNKVIKDARHAYALYNFTLKNNETREFNLQIYLDKDTPMNESTMDASWQGKITLSTEYMKDTNTIREISKTDEDGMWKYKEQLTKIVIEDKKDEKVALDNEVVYGPFAESIYESNGVQSYVVCETGDINCIGYLQGDGGVKLNQNSNYLFSGFTSVSAIDNIEKLDISDVTQMNYMFSNTGVENLNLSMWDVSHVTNMYAMFYDCSSLTQLILANWNLGNLSYNPGLFGGNSNLETIVMYSATFPSNSQGFFSAGLTNLTNLVLGNTHTSNVTNMAEMFSGCSGLTTLDLSSFDTTNLRSVGGMFRDMTNLNNLDLSNWKFNDNIASFFISTSGLSDDKLLSNLTLKNVNTSNVTDMRYMFQGASNIVSLDLSSFDTSQVTKIEHIFEGLSNIKYINLSNWNLSGVRSIGIQDNLLFSSNSSLQSLSMTNFVFPTDSSYFFAYLSSLTDIFLTGSNTSNVTDMSRMFYETSNLNILNLSMWNVSHVTNMTDMFSASGLTNLTLNGWNLSGIADAYNNNQLFPNNPNLSIIRMNGVVFPKNCSNLFYNLKGLTTLELAGSNTSNVTNMKTMFMGCSSLTKLDLSSWNTNNVTEMSAMFNRTSSLEHITFGLNFVHKSGAYTSNMFSECLSTDRPSGDTWQGVIFD